ncbi:unnamed protein product [Mycena citricolor]|uniref:SET domain-containing protein n=1 Tax=Mycena citricolor TaxID=2018698 RepID=A0AAD2GS10_9AGAR|nr:unnamed protein product [Mycena citricolor]
MIEAFYASFPPKSTHVSIQPRDEKLPSAGPVKVLVLNEDIEAGQIIYTEHPMLTSLDFDLQAAGTHCFQCFKELSDPVSLTSAAGDKALFCSTKCQNAAKSQWHSFLFTVDPPIPGVPEFAQLAPTPEGLEARREAQSKFAAYLNKDQKAVSSLVAKFIARQLTAAGQPHAEDDYAQADGAQKYAIEDYVERWTTGKGEPSEEEFGLLVNLMRNTLPGLEAFLPQDGHKSLCGKLAFNAFGVTFGEGREDRPASTHRPENTEITRTAAGTERQTGTALYSISTYLPHSCEPNARATFPNGTSELHLVAAKDLKKGDVLSVAYVDVTQKADESASDCRLRRRKEIARGWKFPCECSRCLAEAQAQN